MEYSEELENYEDIDLLELIGNNKSTNNKYLIFEGSNNEIYGINVAKVVEVLVCKDLNSVKNGNSDSIIRASAKIRDMMATVICFDEWFGNTILDDNEYEYILLAGFGGHTLGIMIKDVDYIISIDTNHMQDNSQNNPKTNFVANIKLHGEERLCTIFDCDKMLLDTFANEITTKNNTHHLSSTTIQSDKVVLFADDSIFIRKMVQKLFDKLDLKYEIFINGQELFERLQVLSPDDIGLIITDLEMPIMDGQHLIESIASLKEYQDINIIVHTNMSNFITETSLMKLGVKEVIAKIDMVLLSEGINKYFSK